MARWSAGIYLVLLGFAGLALLGRFAWLDAALGSIEASHAFAIGSFLCGAFLLLPQPWRWGKRRQTWKRIARAAWTVIGGALALAGVIVVGYVAFSFDAFGPLRAALWLSAAAAAIAGGADLVRDIYFDHEREQSSAPPALHDEQIVRLAAAHRGRLTASDVVSGLGASLAQTERALDRMSAAGLCEPRINPSGGTFYFFRDLATSDAKTDLLESDSMSS